MKKLILLITLAVFAETVLAQSFYNRRIDRKWIASAGSGSAKYFGDLNNPGELFQGTRWNIEVGLERRLDKNFSARLNLTTFQLSGDDELAGSESRAPRNLNFTSWNTELALIGIYQLFPETGRYYQRPTINPFVFAGIGVLYYNPRTDIPATDHDGNSLPNAGKMTSLRQHQTELVSYSPVTLTIPFGVGVEMMITPMLNLSINGVFRYTTTDYLDDISTVHKDDSKFPSPLVAALADRSHELGRTPFEDGHIRGNPDSGDSYFILSVRVDYYLPPGILGKGQRGPLQYNRRRKAPKRR